MATMQIPGHERDALADAHIDALLTRTDVETTSSIHDVFALTGDALLGLEDARVLVDAMAAREWAGMAADVEADEDWFYPSAHDTSVARIAAQG